jgi:hypothetical protein
MRYLIRCNITSAPDRGEWSASCPGHFILYSKSPHYLLNKMLGVPKSWAAYFGEEKALLGQPAS